MATTGWFLSPSSFLLAFPDLFNTLMTDLQLPFESDVLLVCVLVEKKETVLPGKVDHRFVCPYVVHKLTQDAGESFHFLFYAEV